MKSNNRGSKSRGEKRGGGRGGEQLEMHAAVCVKCGSDCEVPFKPNGRKPVLCAKCFNSDSNQSDNPGKRRINDSGKETYSAICDSCGKSCGVPFKPNGIKPVLCSLCFAKSNEEKNSNKAAGSQLDEINEKLDKILKMLAKMTK